MKYEFFITIYGVGEKAICKCYCLKLLQLYLCCNKKAAWGISVKDEFLIPICAAGEKAVWGISICVQKANADCVRNCKLCSQL